MITIAFFNNKGGVGKTSLVYHLAWMFSELGLKVVAADLDPQANLTSMFLDENRLEELWPPGKHPLTIQGVVEPICQDIGDINPPHTEKINDRLHLIPGDLALSNFEDVLSHAWLRGHYRNEASFPIMTALYRALLIAAQGVGSDVVLIDAGPNLGAINRAALIASEYVVIPLASDLFSLRGLQSLGPQLRLWRDAWKELRTKNPEPDLAMPSGEMTPVGYVVLRHATGSDSPVNSYLRWMEKIPTEYQFSVLNKNSVKGWGSVETDPECLATLKHYRSLMPLAMEAHKPMFFLKPADGAIGAHVEAVRDCFGDFQKLAMNIAKKCSIALPPKRQVSF